MSEVPGVSASTLAVRLPAPATILDLDIYDRMSVAREIAGRTHAQVAFALGHLTSGRVATTVVEDMEAGRVSASLALVHAWARVFSVAPAWLVAGRVPQRILIRRLQDARMRAGIDEEEMSASLWPDSVTPVRVRAIEGGREMLGEDEMRAWAERCGVSADDLWTFDARWSATLAS